MSTLNANQFKTIALLAFILLVSIVVYSMNSTINELKAQNIVLKYEKGNLQSERDSLQTNTTTLMKNNDLLTIANNDLKRGIKERDERLVALIQISTKIQATVEATEVYAAVLETKLDSLEKLIVKQVGDNNVDLTDSNKTVINFPIKYNKDEFNLKGNLYAVYDTNTVRLPNRSFSTFDNISFEPRLEIAQTITSDNLIRVYIKSLSPYMTIDSSKLFLDIDFASEDVPEIGENIKSKIGYLLGGGGIKDFRDGSYGISLGAGLYKETLELILSASSNSNVKLDLYKRF